MIPPRLAAPVGTIPAVPCLQKTFLLPPNPYWCLQDCPPGQPAIKEGNQPVKQLQPLQEGSPCIPGRKDWLDHIDDKNVKVYSQNGEDGILLFIFANVGVTSRYFVEFGTQSCQVRKVLWGFKEGVYFGWEWAADSNGMGC